MARDTDEPAARARGEGEFREARSERDDALRRCRERYFPAAVIDNGNRLRERRARDEQAGGKREKAQADTKRNGGILLNGVEGP